MYIKCTQINLNNKNPTLSSEGLIKFKNLQT